MQPLNFRPTDSTSPSAFRGGPAVRGYARAEQVHELKAQGLSPSRRHWREMAVTPAVEVTFSAEATAALAAEASAALSAPPAESEPVVDIYAPPKPAVETAVKAAAEEGAEPAAVEEAVVDIYASSDPAVATSAVAEEPAENPVVEALVGENEEVGSLPAENPILEALIAENAAEQAQPAQESDREAAAPVPPSRREWIFEDHLGVSDFVQALARQAAGDSTPLAEAALSAF